MDLRVYSRYIIVDEITGKSIDNKQYSHTSAKICLTYYKKVLNTKSLRIVKVT